MGVRGQPGVERAAATAPAVSVPCPLLVGRSAELDALAGLLVGARSGRGAMAFVVGEAGIGKSRLAHEVAAKAGADGLRVLRGRAVPGSAPVAFRPLTEALAPVAGEATTAAGLAPWRPALGAIIPVTAPAGGVDATAPVRGEAVLRLLAEVCAPFGGLLVLEDLQWADPETIAVVEHLSDNVERAPVLCVVTVRDGETPAYEMVQRVRARRSALVLPLARLGAAQVAAMVHSCTGGDTGATVERAVALADGVPFLVEEMLVAPGVPASFSETVAARLGELPEQDRRVLAAAAALGRHFDWALLPAAAGVPEADVVEALERAVAAQLLAVEGDGFRFRHALTAEAVFHSLIPPRRQAVAAAALAALDATHPDLPPGAREVAARVAERAGQPERAGRLHLALGEEALTRAALHTAVEALQRAADLLPPGAERDAACARLVDALVLAGRVDDALAVGGALTGRLPATAAAAIHLRVAGGAATAARWALAADHVAEARTLLGPDAVPALQAELLIREAELALGTADAVLAERSAGEALTVARAHGLAESECAALQLLGRAARRASLDAAERWFREALDAADVHGLALWRLRAMHELGTIALLERSEVDLLVEAQQLAEALGAVATAAVLDIEIAAGAAGADDLEVTARHGEQAVVRGRQLGLDLIVAYGWMHVSAAAALRGDRARAAAATAEARAAAPGNLEIEALLVGAPLLAALAADDLDEALVLAARFTELGRAATAVPPAHHRAAWPLLLAVTGSREAPAAIEEIARSDAVVSRGARSWLGLARAVVAGQASGEEAVALAREADALLVSMPVWRSLGRRLTAQAAAAQGWTVPEGWLEEAEACLRAHGYDAPATACRRLRLASPAGVPAAWARAGITKREADVLALVIDGCSNRDIAERLYLSVRTVEKHVEALLRKTATKSRTQLVRAATAT